MLDASVQLNPYVTKLPETKSLQNTQLLYSIAWKVCAVAVVAICGGILAAYFGLLTLPSYVPLLGVFSLFFLVQGSKHFIAKTNSYEEVCKFSKEIDDQHDKLKELDDEALEGCLKNQKIELREGTDPKTLLPLFARYLTYQNQASIYYQNMTARNCPLDRQYCILEVQLLPAAYTAALFHYILSNPTCPYESLNEIGTLNIEDPGTRALEEREGKDDYFVSKDSEKMPSLTLSETLNILHFPAEIGDPTLRLKVADAVKDTFDEENPQTTLKSYSLAALQKLYPKPESIGGEEEPHRHIPELSKRLFSSLNGSNSG